MCSKWLCWFLCVHLCFVCVYTSEYHSIVEKVVYKYPGEAKGDLELPECEGYSVCGVMRLRFWQPPTLHRLCRCVHGTECPWKWAASSTDDFTMQLDNRSQLKFCQKVSELAVCPAGKTSMVVSTRRGSETELTTEAVCRCQWPAYWQLQRNYYHDFFNGTVVNVNYYRCAKLTRCDRYDFCGNVVYDTFSTYYRCSCPAGTLCLNKDRSLRNTTELLYEGPTYRAYCLPSDTPVS